MDIQSIAQQLLPCWMLGLIVLSFVRDSKYKDLLRVEKGAILKFLKWMAILTIYRILVLKFFSPHDTLEQIKSVSSFIPWQATLGVFWEDAVHAIPLVLLAKMFDKQKWYKWAKYPLLIGVMASFGSGHMYQGALSAIALSFYIPFSMKMGQKVGFGTVMLCHIMYDLITLLSLGWIAGA